MTRRRPCYADRVVFLGDGRIVDEMVAADGRAGPRSHEEPGVAGHVESDPRQPAGPPAAPDPDRALHRAGRGVRHRDADLHRHPAQHLRPAFQRRLRQDQRAGAPAVAGHRPIRQQVVHPDARRRSCRRSPACPGVAASEGSVSGFAQLVDKHDKAITTNGAPTIGASYGTGPRDLRLLPRLRPGPARPRRRS